MKQVTHLYQCQPHLDRLYVPLFIVNFAAYLFPELLKRSVCPVMTLVIRLTFASIRLIVFETQELFKHSFLLAVFEHCEGL